jgi:beta-galactosidase GanA
VEWRLHEKKPGVFDFTGNNDIVKFINTAAEEGLLVILRLGPYIDGEREMVDKF